MQVQALEVERRTLEAELECSRDSLGDAKSLVEQLRLENTRKVRPAVCASNCDILVDFKLASRIVQGAKNGIQLQYIFKHSFVVLILC